MDMDIIREKTMKAVLRKKTCTLPALVTLLTIVGLGLIASYAFAADPESGIDETAFLDPFALTVYQPPASVESTDEAVEEFLPGTTLFEMMSPPTNRGIPISTWRTWVMTPYRPPLRSPFLPW